MKRGERKKKYFFRKFNGRVVRKRIAYTWNQKKLCFLGSFFSDFFPCVFFVVRKTEFSFLFFLLIFFPRV